MKFEDLEIYKLSREISGDAWEIYKNFEWETRKVIGDQFIRSIDSIGANIAEGCGRFHYLDRNKFNYNARGSLVESIHWIELLVERGIIKKEEGDALKNKMEILHHKLNNYINATKEHNRDK
ncbi:MAG TPA: four helix bundle protein [Candidatus Paceibacterota bacterium]|nr:four helix bundle protein [Candidatus Paceibacterota bacterium]